MDEFIPPEEFVVDQYYGVSMMTIKKNGAFSIQLQYDYKKRAIVSNSLELNELEQAIEAFRILSKYSTSQKSLPKTLGYI